MFRFLAPCSLLFVAASPVSAASYTARLAKPTSQRIIARDITWQCSSDGCVGESLESRPVVLCESIAKRAGKVESFVVDGRVFSAPELATCNASVKAVGDRALASQ